MDKPRVVNVKDKKASYDVYIGRPSKWGNKWSHIPFGTLAQYVVDSREEAIRCYEEDALSKPEFIAMIKRELKGKILACYCYPLACHGDFLLKIANEEE